MKLILMGRFLNSFVMNYSIKLCNVMYCVCRITVVVEPSYRAPHILYFMYQSVSVSLFVIVFVFCSTPFYFVTVLCSSCSNTTVPEDGR